MKNLEKKFSWKKICRGKSLFNLAKYFLSRALILNARNERIHIYLCLCSSGLCFNWHTYTCKPWVLFHIDFYFLLFTFYCNNLEDNFLLVKKECWMVNKKANIYDHISNMCVMFMERLILIEIFSTKYILFWNKLHIFGKSFFNVFFSMLIMIFVMFFVYWMKMNCNFNNVCLLWICCSYSNDLKLTIDILWVTCWGEEIKDI